MISTLTRLNRALPAVMASLMLVPAGCEQRDRPEIDGDDPAAQEQTVWFEEVSEQAGLMFEHESGFDDAYYLPEITSGGAAVFDFDGDGWLDVYLVQSGSMFDETQQRPANQLFRNRGDGSFENVTHGSGADDRGIGMGAAVGDYDNDGHADLYITNLGSNVLLRNNGDATFSDITADANVGHDGWSSSATFFDADNDGDLDLYVANYLRWSPDSELNCSGASGQPDYCHPESYDSPAPDVLYRNNGDGTFTDDSRDAGLRAAFGNGLGVVALDADGDGLVDVFVANDMNPNQLWMNQGDGTFVDEAMIAGCAIDQHGEAKAGMGVTAIDHDDNGREDIFVVNLQGQADSVYRNQGGYFVDDTTRVGIAAASRQFTRFGMGVLDFDNDGKLDMFHANGAVYRLSPNQRWSDDPYAEPNALFRGVDGGFEPIKPHGGTRSPLIATSRAAAFGDLDNDGRVDIVVVNRDGPTHLLRNVSQRGVDEDNWIMFRVLDEHGRDAYNAQLTMNVGDRTITREVRSGYSYLAANDPRVHVGLGSDKTVREVTITWRDGTQQDFGDFEARKIIMLQR